MGFLVWSSYAVAFKTLSGTKGIGPILSSSQVVLISDLIEVTLLFLCLPRAQGKIGLTLCLVYPPLFLLLFILERILWNSWICPTKGTPQAQCYHHWEKFAACSMGSLFHILNPGTSPQHQTCFLQPSIPPGLSGITELTPVSARATEAFKDIASTLWILKCAFNI